MTISMRELFTRPGIATSAGQTEPEIISLRNSLANHHQGLEKSLRQAHEAFTQQLAPGDGYARGCKHTWGGRGAIAEVIPSWVSAHDAETRTVEGVLRRSYIAWSDFPLRPWHKYYDWDLLLEPDPQYRYLLSAANENYPDELVRNVLECEWDSADVPIWAWPQDGNRIWIVGRWIYDCGHPLEHYGHKTEIHPPKAIASFRTEAVQFAGNSGPTRANNAVLFIGRDGGYWRQPINDQDYAFDLYLPPKPYSEATPEWKLTQQTPLPVPPRITPYPAENPRVLRVVIPLRGVTPHPESYGTIISGGWSDPRGTESANIQRVRVNIQKILLDADFDTVTGDEWYLYVCVNGRWRIWEDFTGEEHPLNFSVDLDLHPGDTVRITACGFEADLQDDVIGRSSGFSWQEISAPNMPRERTIQIINRIIVLLADAADPTSSSFIDENERLDHFRDDTPSTERVVTPRTKASIPHPSRASLPSPFNEPHYRLRYTVTDR